MSFMIHSVDDGRIPSFHTLNTPGIDVGNAVYLLNGTALTATGLKKPTYICVGKGSSEYEIQAIRVASDIVFETTAGANLTDVQEGDLVKISDDAEQVIPVNSNETGIAEVVYLSEKTKGSVVRVRFI